MDQASALAFADPLGKDSNVSFEMAGALRTRASGPLKWRAGFLVMMGDAFVMHAGTVSPEFQQYVGGFPPKHATDCFDADRFDDIKAANQNGGVDRCKQSGEQGVCKYSVNLVCRTHMIGAFDNISPNSDVTARYLPFHKSACALERSDTAPRDRMTLSGSKPSLGRRK
jgi:hypothetical protein